jgi:cytochrome c
MGGMEFNKIFAAILVAGIIAMLSGFISKQIVHAEKPEKNAFEIAAAEDTGGAGGGKAAGPEPILAMLASADAARGEKVAKACAACHTFVKGGPNGVGPNLWGVVGGPKQHAAGFAYSGALIKQGGDKWTYEELNKFLWKPKAYAPETKMSFAGVKKADDRAALIAWLRQQADFPPALPSEADIKAETAALGGDEEAVAPSAATDGKDAVPAAAPAEKAKK